MSNSKKLQNSNSGLPAGWVTRTSRTTGQVYFYNSKTGITTFDNPGQPTLLPVSPSPQHNLILRDASERSLVVTGEPVFSAG